MRRIISFIWSGCWHRWKIMHEVDVYARRQEVPVGIRYDLQCEKCGDVTSRSFL